VVGLPGARDTTSLFGMVNYPWEYLQLTAPAKSNGAGDGFGHARPARVGTDI
jgi:hypothetical protein